MKILAVGTLFALAGCGPTSAPTAVATPGTPEDEPSQRSSDPPAVAAPDAGSSDALVDAAQQTDDCADLGAELLERVVSAWDECYARVPARNRLGGLARIVIYFEDDGAVHSMNWQGQTAWGPRAAQCMLDVAGALEPPKTECHSVTLEKVYQRKGGL